MSIYQKMQGLSLRREDETHHYTLEGIQDSSDLDWNGIFKLRNATTANLLPSRFESKVFAGAVAILNMFGYKITDMTTVRGGYLFQVDDGDNKILMFSAQCQGSRHHIMDVVKGVIEGQLPNMSTKEREVASAIFESMGKDECMIATALKASNMAKTLECDRFISNIESGYKAFQDKNNLNCDENHKILSDIIVRHLTEDERFADKKDDEARRAQVESLSRASISEKEKNGEPLTEDEKYYASNYDKIMVWIIDGYFKYVGHDREGNPVPVDKDILNNRVTECVEMMGNREDAAEILRMCSMDYPMDMVQSTLSIIKDYKYDQECGRSYNEDVNRIISDEVNPLLEVSIDHDTKTEKAELELQTSNTKPSESVFNQ